MRAGRNVALAGVAVLTSPLLVGAVVAPTADAVGQVAAAPRGNNDDKKNDDKKNDDKKNDDKGDKKGKGDGPSRPRDRTPPARPVLGDAGVGPGGRVSLPVIAESGSSVVVTESGSVVASGTGYGGYASVGWTASHGTHTYTVTARDGAGNRSRPARTTVAVDAVPPRLGAVRLFRGSSEDPRTRLGFRTDAGSLYRVLSDGRQVASGSTDRPAVQRLLDLANGRHRIEVRVRDAVGNARIAARPVVVRIRDLAVTTRRTSDPTQGTQAVRVRTSPTARRGVVRLPGQDPVAFVVRRGAATVELDLPDGTYRDGTVLVRDARGRSGRERLPRLTVDTTPPTLDVAPDPGAAADGMLQAAVSTEAGATVRWRALDSDGDVATSGQVALEDGEGTLSADVDKGDYRLVVVATDTFDQATKARSSARVAEDPWPTVVVAALWALLALGLVAAATGLVLLVRRARQHGSVVRRATATVTRVVRERLRAFLGPVPEGDAAATFAALLEPEPEPRSERQAPRIPFPRLASRSGGALPPDDQVFHRTPVRVYETAEEREDGPVLGSRPAELVVARDSIALVDDRTGDVWSCRVAERAHVGDDTTMVLPAGGSGWFGLVYADHEMTRLALDLVAADTGERPLAGTGPRRD